MQELCFLVGKWRVDDAADAALVSRTEANDARILDEMMVGSTGGRSPANDVDDTYSSSGLPGGIHEFRVCCS